MDNLDLQPYDYCAVAIGMTGSGKSSFLNSIHNYLDAKELINLAEPFKIGNGINSQTANICLNYIVSKHNQKTYLLIDTPGLCDTSGIPEIEDGIVKNILDILRKLPHINAILYVSNSGTNFISKEFRKAAKEMLGFLVTDVREVVYAISTYSSFSEDFFGENEGGTDKILLQDLQIKLQIDVAPENTLKINNYFYSLSSGVLNSHYGEVSNDWIIFCNEKLSKIVEMIESDKISTNQYNQFEDIKRSIKKIVFESTKSKTEFLFILRLIEENIKIDHESNNSTNIIKEKKLVSTPFSNNFYCEICKNNCIEDVGKFRKFILNIENTIQSKCNVCRHLNTNHFCDRNKYIYEEKEVNDFSKNQLMDRFGLTSEQYNLKKFDKSSIISSLQKEYKKKIASIMGKCMKKLHKINKLIPEFSIKETLSGILAMLKYEQKASINSSQEIISNINSAIEIVKDLLAFDDII
ncbi:hypothetical protein SteCoe_1981 [Stentor coeruleus]|uniref:Uncharacterized protein n=1 Tax=Stentor coeruleus TaxID=5963 RepID=A0A1R2D0L0_9CILI|nr:hypothetical protein SteCoe_1981 [Stentor coeruleus]